MIESFFFLLLDFLSWLKVSPFPGIMQIVLRNSLRNSLMQIFFLLDASCFALHSGPWNILSLFLYWDEARVECTFLPTSDRRCQHHCAVSAPAPDGWATVPLPGSRHWNCLAPLARCPALFYTCFMAILNTLHKVLTITENPFFITKL